MKNGTNLVDAVSLSQQLCSVPVKGDLKYSYHENFIGRPIAGYQQDIRDICLLAPQAAKMLCKVQNILVSEYQLSLIIFDAYRPLRAIRDFVKWFDEIPTEQEIQRKQIHYPSLLKNELANHGYIAEGISNHCYGQAVDVSLVSLNSHTELDMGTCFDYFGELSHSTQPEHSIGKIPYQNRKCLQVAMEQFGFIVHPKEYWHFDFHIRENLDPFDIVIEEAVRGLGVTINETSVEGA
jgi:D-alanyl-D-alanine dipeptidase